MKKKFLAVLSCGLAATFLFGCSNNASQKAETTAAQTEAAKESQKPSEETEEKTGTDRFRGRNDLWCHLLDRV